jgi:DegV family protein with EDD domain
MSKVCILTDSTVQFPIPAFEGRKLVNIVPLKITPEQINGNLTNELRAHDLTSSAPEDYSLQVHAPTVETFENNYLNLAQYYAGIVVIVHARGLSKTYQNAFKAAKNLQGQVNVEVIDSETIATGLGLAVQAAASAAEQEQSIEEISEYIRSLLPRIYSVFCIPGLSYLHHSGYLNRSQAVVGEHLKLLPVYILEESQLVPTQKARNHRHLVDLLHEFISEFYTLDHIGIIQGVPAFESETRALRERLVPEYENTEISEHIISPELAAKIGPHTIAVFLLQAEEQ